jgi:hypothetical protein
MPEIEYLIASLDLGVNFLFWAPKGLSASQFQFRVYLARSCSLSFSTSFVCESCVNPRDKIKQIITICLAAF